MNNKLRTRPLQFNINVHSAEWGYVFAAITLFIWSCFPIVSRIGGQGTLNQYDILALRVGVAAVVLGPWWVPRLLKPQKRKLTLYQTVTFSMLAGLAYPLIAFTALRYAPANHGAVFVVGALPVFTTILGVWVLGKFPDRLTNFSLSFVVLGVIILFISHNLTSGIHPTELGGDALLLLASLVWALFTVLLKRWDARAFDVTLGSVAVAAMLYLPIYLLFLDKGISAASWSEIAIQAGFQGFVVPCVAIFTYSKAIECLGPFRTVVFLAATPMVGTLMATTILGEILHLGSSVACMLVFIGSVMGAVAKRGM